MGDELEREWCHIATGGLPCDNRAVVVLVALKDGTFKPDLGRYYGKHGWNVLFWKDLPVVAWDNIPDFLDDTEIIEAEEAA